MMGSRRAIQTADTKRVDMPGQEAGRGAPWRKEDQRDGGHHVHDVQWIRRRERFTYLFGMHGQWLPRHLEYAPSAGGTRAGQPGGV
jgi:hypothetical protein